MATKDMDDPMDLGPFFQSYILQNPFSSLMVAPKKENDVEVKLRTPKPKILPLAPSTTSHDAPCDALAVPPAGDRGKVKPTVSNEVSKVLRDTPKAHIGSNFHFAMMLRHFKVSDIHRDIQKWFVELRCFSLFVWLHQFKRLWDEYRYVTEYCGQMHASDLLTAVQKQFPELTSSVLSRVMKFTFPKCPKMLNKLGTFYTGLVRRPELEDYQNLDALRAADHVTNTSCSLEIAASVYLVSEATVASVLYWRNCPAASLPNPMSLPSLMDTCDDNSDDSVTCHQTPDASDSDMSPSPPPRNALHRLGQQNTTVASVIDSTLRNQGPAHHNTTVASVVGSSNATTDDWTGGMTPADSTDSRGSISSHRLDRRPRKRTKSGDCINVLDKRIKPEAGNGQWCIRLKRVSSDGDQGCVEGQCRVEDQLCVEGQGRVEDEGCIAVKEERVDMSYSKDITASRGPCITGDRTTNSARIRRSVSDREGGVATNHVSASVRPLNSSTAMSSNNTSTPVGSISSRVDRTSMCSLVSSCTDSDADKISSTVRSRPLHTTDDSVINSALLQSVESNHTLRRRLEQTQRHLVEQQEDSARMTRELAAAQRRVQSLEHNLDARNRQLTQLAEEFFAFGDKFQQLSRHFQLALIGITEPGDTGKSS